MSADGSHLYVASFTDDAVALFTRDTNSSSPTYGQITYSAAVFDNVTGTIGPIRSGLVRAIGVTSGERIDSLPDVPTLSEAGLPGFKNSSWISVFTRAGVPKDALAALESATLKVANDPSVQERLKELGAVPEPMGSQELDRFWKSEFDYWQGAIKAANLKIE